MNGENDTDDWEMPDGEQGDEMLAFNHRFGGMSWLEVPEEGSVTSLSDECHFNKQLFPGVITIYAHST